MNPEIKITITPFQPMQIEINGVVGEGCDKLTELLEAQSKVIEKTYKDEFYQQEIVENQLEMLND